MEKQRRNLKPVFLLGVARALLSTLLVIAAATATWGQERSADLAEKSLEDLMNIEVTSVSRKEQKISETAAAVYVITQEDVRRSGATNIPDLLRMIPGLDVAQINASTWAISARGFNDQFANKMLVLIDGRTVYTPSFSGVYWDLQDVPLEDIERIEAIRGLGATIWGSNAVNGVINIITKKADATPGTFLSTGGGNLEQGFGTVRYGGQLGGRTHYRVFGRYFNRFHLEDQAGQSGKDSWHQLHGGFRWDSPLSPTNSLTFEGNLYKGGEGKVAPTLVSLEPPLLQARPSSTTLTGGSFLGRWNHLFSNRSDTSLQIFFDRFLRRDSSFRERRNTTDLDFQHHFAGGDRQDVVWGFEYRGSVDDTDGEQTISFDPEEWLGHFISGFFQDEITLVPDRLFFTVGAKIEHNSFSGFEALPSVRLAWTPSHRHAFWAAVSRAARIPSRADTAMRINRAVFQAPGQPVTLVSQFGNPRFHSERLTAYEVGYRAQPNNRFSVDLASFLNAYHDLRNIAPGTPFFEADPEPAHLVAPLFVSQNMEGETHGLEVFSTWKVNDRWAISPGYSLLMIHLRLEPGSPPDTQPALTEGSSPRHQAQLRSRWVLPRNLELDASAFFVGRLASQATPSYTRLDLRLGWHPAERFQMNFVGQNLLRNRHLEFGAIQDTISPSEVRRSAYVEMSWLF